MKSPTCSSKSSCSGGRPLSSTANLGRSIPSEDSILNIRKCPLLSYYINHSIPIHLSPILDDKLRLQIVDYHGLPEVGVRDGLFQREPLGVEGDEAITERPGLYRLL